MTRLNQRQENFCQEYMIDGNATAAYIRAGYASRGNAAEVSAYQLLRNPKIQARLQELTADKSGRLNNLSDRVMGELEKIAFANGLDALEWDDEQGYRLRPPERMNERLRVAISEIKFSRLGVTVRLHDKVAALGKIAQIMGMTSDLNMAIAALRKYGINLVAENGQWKLIDVQQPEEPDNSEQLEGSEEGTTDDWDENEEDTN